MSLPARRIEPLESLRGIAALAVAIFHFRTPSPLAANAFIDHADLMVDLFFVLSGFVIALNYSERIGSFWDALTFQRRRFWRLYPLHLFTLMVFVAIECAKLGFERFTGIASDPPAFSVNGLEAFVNHLFLTQAVYLDSLTFNGPSWSISTEFYTYLIFAAVALLCRQWLLLAAVCIVAVAGSCLHAYDAMHDTTRWAIVRCLYGFFLGVAAYHVATRIRIGAAAVLLLLAAMAVAFADKVAAILIPWLFAALVVSLAQMPPQSTLHRAMSARPLVFLGTISYSVYLMHPAVWWAAKQVLRFGFGVTAYTDANGAEIVALSPLTGTAVTLLGLALIVLVSAVTYKAVEDRFRRGTGFRPPPEPRPRRADG